MPETMETEEIGPGLGKLWEKLVSRIWLDMGCQEEKELGMIPYFMDP